METLTPWVPGLQGVKGLLSLPLREDLQARPRGEVKASQLPVLCPEEVAQVLTVVLSGKA